MIFTKKPSIINSEVNFFIFLLRQRPRDVLAHQRACVTGALRQRVAHGSLLRHSFSFARLQRQNFLLDRDSRKLWVFVNQDRTFQQCAGRYPRIGDRQ